MALLYKGYAQQKGFGSYLVDVPDPSKKIRNQGLQAMGHMKDQIEWNNKNAQRVQNTLVANANHEAQVRRSNFELGQQINQTIHDQKQRNFNDRIKAAEAKRAANKAKIQNLLSLTQSGTQIWKAYDTHQKKSANANAHMLWEEHGIGMKALNGVQAIDDALWNNSSAREAELTRLGLDGVSEDVLNELRSYSGYRRSAIAQNSAVRWARQRGQEYETRRNKEYTLADGTKVSLESAKGAQIDTVLQLIDREVRDELGDNAPSSKVMAQSGSYQILEQFRAQQRSFKQSEARQDAIAARHQDEWEILEKELNPDNTGFISTGAGLIKAIEYYAGPDATAEDYRRAKKRVFDAYRAGLINGRFSYESALGAGDYKFQHSSGEVSIRKIFKNEWIGIENAVIEGQKRSYALASIAHGKRNIDDLNNLTELYALDFSNGQGIKAAHDIAVTKGWAKSAAFLSNLQTRAMTNAGNEQVMSIVQAAIGRNEHMTKQEIAALGASPQGTEAAWQLMQKHSKFLPDTYGHAETIEDTVDALLEAKITTPLTGKNDYTRAEARRIALDRTRAEYRDYMTQPGATPEKAKEHAIGFLKNLIETDPGYQPRMDYSSRMYGFPIGMVNAHGFDIKNDAAGVSRELNQDRTNIYNQPYLDRNTLAQKSANLAKGINQDILPRAVFIEDLTNNNIRALEAEQAQIEHYNRLAKETNQPLIQPYPDWYVKQVKGTYEKFNPNVLRYLKKHDYCKINQAACSSGMNPIYTRPAYNKARNIVRGTLGTNNAGDYNATESGSSLKRKDLKGIEIVDASLNQIIQMQTNGQLITAGRYQFTNEQLIEAAELAKVPLTEKFSPDNQNKLFDALFKKNGPIMIENIPNSEDRFLLLDIYESLTTDKTSDLGYRAPRTLSVAAYKELNARGYFS